MPVELVTIDRVPTIFPGFTALVECIRFGCVAADSALEQYYPSD